jgi:hypothetical protein
MSTATIQHQTAPAVPETPGLTIDQNFGIARVEHRLTLQKAETVSKEIKLIDKAVAKEYNGVFDLDALIEWLEVFIRLQFPDEPDPHGLARWFAGQYVHYKADAYCNADARIAKPDAKKRRRKNEKK